MYNNLERTTLLLLSFTAKAVFGAVEESFDVRLVLHDDEHRDNQSQNHLPEVYAFEIVFRAYIPKDGKDSEQGAPENTTDRHVLCRNRKDYP